jgi:hypothetical protein
MGVPPTAISGILATHWHDDHVGGIADLYGAATNAELIFPLAMTTEEFMSFAARAAGQAVGKVTSGLDELGKLAKVRADQGRGAPKRAQADTVLFRTEIDLGDEKIELLLTALSPSVADVDAFFEAIAPVATGNPIVARVMPKDPNDISVACSLIIGDDSVLLGADLTERSDPGRGWKAVVASANWKKIPASVFKVAHHGSRNAHSDDVWATLLRPDAFAILAPYNRGYGVPKGADVQRIMGLTQHGYTTTQSPFRKYRGESAILEKALDESGIKMNSLPAEVGVVRLRRRVAKNSPWVIDTFRGATHLKNFVPRS